MTNLLDVLVHIAKDNWYLSIVAIIIIAMSFLKRRKKKKQQESEEETEVVKIQGVDSLEQEIQSFDLAKAPTSSTFTANELYLLQQAGFEVRQLVFGNIVYSMGTKGLFRTVRRAFKQGEMPDFTRMINDSRIIARNRMLKQAEEVGATGVIDVIFDLREFADFIEITATGTAVKKVGEHKSVPVAVGA